MFQEHSYRGFTKDPVTGNLFMTNIEYSIEHDFLYALTDAHHRCLRSCKLDLPLRTCYHDMAMRNKELYIFGVRDIVELNPVWKESKYKLTGNKWDYDFRQICLNYCPDIETADFESLQAICDRDATC